MNVEILEEIENDTARTVKEAYLAKADEPLRRFLKKTLDQNVTYGVTVDEDELLKLFDVQVTRAQDPIKWWDTAWDILAKLETRELGGAYGKAAIEQHIVHGPDHVSAKWLCRFVNRNLRAGFDIKIFNAVFDEDAVDKFRVQLAETYEEKMDMRGEWLIEPKLNGNRVVGKDSIFNSRGNREYTAAPEILAELQAIPGFFDEYITDGEMMGNLGFDKSSGALRRKTGKNKKAEFTYWMFDLFLHNEWQGKTATLRERKQRMVEFFAKHKFQHIQMVPWRVVTNPTFKQIEDICKEYVANGFEGIMLKKLDAPAVFDRSNTLLKFKLFYEDEFHIVDFYSGRGKRKNTLGGVIVEGDIKWGHYGHEQLPRHVRSKCGSGFSDPMLDLIWNNKADWMGAIVQVQFQEVTAAGSLQFPVFVMRRKDKEGVTVADAPREPWHEPKSVGMTDKELDSLLDDLDKEYND